MFISLWQLIHFHSPWQSIDHLIQHYTVRISGQSNIHVGLQLKFPPIASHSCKIFKQLISLPQRITLSRRCPLCGKDGTQSKHLASDPTQIGGLWFARWPDPIAERSNDQIMPWVLNYVQHHKFHSQHTKSYKLLIER